MGNQAAVELVRRAGAENLAQLADLLAGRPDAQRARQRRLLGRTARADLSRREADADGLENGVRDCFERRRRNAAVELAEPRTIHRSHLKG